MGNTHSWRASRAVAGTLLAALGASVLTATAAGATSDDTYPGSEVYGFESAASIDAEGTDGLTGVSVAKTGADGLDAASGCYYAVASQNLDDAGYEYQMTRFGGYSNTFPEGGWFTSADFYLDTEVETGGTLNQFDWSVASNNTAGDHRRDFILHAQSAGEGSWTLGASNNAGFAAVDVAPLSGDTLTIDESGWYTVSHTFSDVDGVLSVDISVADAEGTVLKTWTKSNVKDVIGDTVGGNRYGWIVTNGFDALPVDNVLINAERPTGGCEPVVAESFDATCSADGGFAYTVTPLWTEGDRTFQVKNLGDGTGGTAETFYYEDGTTGAPGEIVPFATVAAGETATLELDNLEPGDYRVVSDGSTKIKKQYKFDFTVAAAEACTVPGSDVYGFETEASVESFGNVTPVKTGTAGIPAAAGCYYAVAGQNVDGDDYAYQFTRFGGYSNTFPEGGWFTSADFYLDTEVETGGTLNQFDWSVASNNTAGDHRRDFILHAQSAGEGSWTLGASNNAGFAAVDVAPLSGDTLTIDESGWYTVSHTFSDVDGVLSVDISVADAEGTVLKTWTKSNAKDVIGDTVGGNRYGWIVTNGFDALPVDNVLINAERPTDTCVPTVYFSDVPEGAKGFAAITWLHEQGIAAGYSDGTFRPTASVTRRSVAKMLYRFAGRPDFELPTESPFTDIEPGDNGYRAMVWLNEQEIATGYGDGSFRPKVTVSRRSMAKLLYRFAGRPAVEMPDTTPFTDVAAGDNGYRAMVFMVNEGIASGYTDGSFRPRQDMIRRQMAGFLYRFSSL
ncbi:S-layer homology domain-containing protein [Demequina sp. SYSU T00192]|uniref:S-layer homology domain-containing protein n=1 Tax=Demequina litoralis TaxID=3051660 RepID=A0ABT8G968_9MICO|nr:S-layer homology domain-containing protein [Demequina sp. SYSU T00192]MDN4475685.1 S-layer homology domain-containing protein [Demequina sp. SYSU T00192]